jgi:transcriptional regulator with XRE-family HTH domain
MWTMPTEMPNTLASYLEREMAQRGWSQRMAAAKAGLSKGTLTDILNRPERTPDLGTLKKLAAGFSVPFRKLLELSGYPVDEEAQTGDPLAALTEEDRSRLLRLNPLQIQALLDLIEQIDPEATRPRRTGHE